MKNLLFCILVIFVSCQEELIIPNVNTENTATNSKSLPLCQIEIGRVNFIGDIEYKEKTIYAFYYKSQFRYLCYFDDNQDDKAVKIKIEVGSILYQSVISKCGTYLIP